MIKAFFVLILLAVGGYFAVNNIPALRERVIEVINPSAKQARLVDELDDNLGQIQSAIGEIAGTQTASARNTQVSKIKTLISESNKTISDLQESQNANSGLVKSIINKITSNLFDSTPYPAEDLTTSKPAPTQIICPTLPIPTKF